MRVAPHAPGEKNEENTYTVWTWCNNCGHKQKVNIPKGVLVVRYLKMEKCSDCDCAGTLRVKDE